MRTSGRLGLLLGAIVIAVAFQGTPAAAAAYENPQQHYTVVAPAGWVQLEPTPQGFDIAFAADPNSTDNGLFGASSFGNPGAENTSAYLVDVARSAEQAEIRGGFTQVSAPQAESFGGRPASNYEIAASNNSVSLLFRIVHFASVFYHLEYVLIFSARSDISAPMEPEWTSVANSFHVLGEPSVPTRYVAPQGNYSIVAPVAWTLGEANDSIVSFDDPNPGDLASFLLSRFESPLSENTTAYVLREAQEEEARLQADGYAAVIASHSTNVSNRPEAEFEMQNSTEPGGHTERWAFFASGYYHTTYVVVLQARSDRFDSLQPEWTSILNSFAIQREGPIVTRSNLPGILALAGQLSILIILLVLAIVVLVRRRQAKAGARSRTPPPPTAAPPSVQAPAELARPERLPGHPSRARKPPPPTGPP